MKQQAENRKYYEAYDERYKQIHSMNLEWEANVHSPITFERRRVWIDIING